MRFYIIAGYLFTAVFGTLSHFLYDCSGQNLFIALFAPVNESIWEHMKLSFFPVLLYAFFLSYIRQPEKEFHTLRDALLLGNFVGTFSIPVLFYTSLPQISPSFYSVFSLLSDSHGKERIRSGQTAGENGFIY